MNCQQWPDLIIPKQGAFTYRPQTFRQVVGYTRRLVKHVSFMRTLAKPGEFWQTHNDTFMRSSPTFTRVPAKFPHIHQSSGEGAFCMWICFRMCPKLAQNFPLSCEFDPFLWGKKQRNPQQIGGPHGSGAQKEPQSQKIARTAPKNFLNNSRGLPVIAQ